MQPEHRENCDHSDGVKQQSPIKQGHRIRLALECLAGESLSARLKRTPPVTGESAGHLNAVHPDITTKDQLNFTRVDDIRRALYALCTRQDTDLAAQLELLVRFDDLEG